jgi:hypothetical protein
MAAQLIVNEVGNRDHSRDAVGNQAIPPLVVWDLTAIEALDPEDEPDIQGLPMSAWGALRLVGHLPRTGLLA